MAKANDTETTAGVPEKNPAPKDRPTSGDSEESMSESSKDSFGKQRSASSGTTPLAGDSAANNDKPGPGGVEGTGGNT